MKRAGAYSQGIGLEPRLPEGARRAFAVLGSLGVLALAAGTIVQLETAGRPMAPTPEAPAAPAAPAAAPHLPGAWPDEPLMPRLVDDLPEDEEEFAGYGPGAFWSLEPLPPVGPPLRVQGGETVDPDAPDPAAPPDPVLTPPERSAETTAARPLAVTLALPDERVVLPSGEALAQVQIGASHPSYLLLFRVRADGEVSLQYPPRFDIPVQPGQTYDQVLPLGETQPDILVAIGAVRPLTAADALAALEPADLADPGPGGEALPAGASAALREFLREAGGEALPAGASAALREFLREAAGEAAAALSTWEPHEWAVGILSLPPGEEPGR